MGATDIREAADGAEALQLLDGGFPPDLILCDVKMRPMDGITFLRQLRQHPNTACAKVPVILLTLDADAATVGAAQSLGVSSFLAKPISPKLLIERITAALRPQ